ncbi:hypothetical protein SKAU_G00300370 [Synaphobranchus kaupii]|uniref:Fibronectin type-III domain-containing protein n=1 Tax=Synaphobranchus kaupii TaxID=118154 RepID=A0A9Q1EVM6_SYNKA|nr:hypothetical protein SKAU_G00300370 [Synaphobranchus kaupii]
MVRGTNKVLIRWKSWSPGQRRARIQRQDLAGRTRTLTQQSTPLTAIPTGEVSEVVGVEEHAALPPSKQRKKEDVEAWKEIRDGLHLSAVESLGPPEDPHCAICQGPLEGLAIWRCRDCDGDAVFCESCTCQMHKQTNTVHDLQLWEDGGFLQRSPNNFRWEWTRRDRHKCSTLYVRQLNVFDSKADGLFGLPRKKSSGESFEAPKQGERMFLDQEKVDKFVVSGHTPVELKYNTRYYEGTGLADGEQSERLWSYLRKFGKITKEMTPSHRNDLLMDALLHYSKKVERKQITLRPQRWAKAIKLKEEATAEFTALLQSVPEAYENFCCCLLDVVHRPQQPKAMAWLWACLFLLPAIFHQQVLGVTVTCLWEGYFLVGGNVSGACQVGLAPLGCEGQSLRLTAAGDPVLAYRYANDSAHFTVPAASESTLHLRCELTCAGLKPLPYCDVTLQGGYPPSAPSRPDCHIPFNSADVHCAWDPGKQPPLPVSYALHWEQDRFGEQEVEAGNRAAVIPRHEFSHGTMTVWVVASSPLGSAESERHSFDTLEVVQPLFPNITHHSVPHLEIFWDLECDSSFHMTEDSDRSCEVQYRTRDERAWTEGDDDAQDSFLLLDPKPFSEYEFRVRCACFGKEAVRSAWSHIYSVQISEAAPAGKLDMWSDCEEDSDRQSECVIVWKKPPLSVARGRVLGYVVTVERDPGNQAVMNLSAEALGATEGAEHMGGRWGAQCFRLPLSLQGITGVYLTAYTSQGATDPASLALPAPGPQLLASGDIVVAAEGRSFNVSWAPPSHLTGKVQYVAQLKEAGVRPTQAFDWIKLNGSQRSFILTGDFRNYTPYSISLFSVVNNRRQLLGSAITYTVQGVPPKVTEFKVSQISFSEVTLTWELPLNQRRGVILYYHLGLGKHTEYNVSGDSSSLLISGLQPGQEHQVWICAESEAGQGPRQYLSFMTTATDEYIIYLSIFFAVLALVVILLLSCRQYGVHSLKQLECCAKVPDPTNSRLFRQPRVRACSFALQCSWTGWAALFSMAESTQLSELEIVEWQDLEESGPQERTPLPDGQVREERTHTEEEEEKGGLDLNSRRGDYSKMIDTEGDEESLSWSPTETEDFFSGYEKHFMPSPLEV